MRDLILKRRGRACDRSRVGLESEQVGTNLVVQLERGAPPLVVLRRDQPMVERFVFGAQGIECLRQRVEPIGDGGELFRPRPLEAHPIIALFQVGEPVDDAAQRAEHPSEQNIENADDGDIHAERNGAERYGVAPHFCDLVAGFRHDLDRPDARRVDDDRHVTARDRRSDQRREPRRCAIVPRCVGGANGTAWRERRAGGVLHNNPHVAHEPQLRAEVGEKFFCRNLLLHEGDSLAHEQLAQLHRRGDLDSRGCAGLEDGHGARHQTRDDVDGNENDEELRADGAAMPQRMRQALCR